MQIKTRIAGPQNELLHLQVAKISALIFLHIYHSIQFNSCRSTIYTDSSLGQIWGGGASVSFVESKSESQVVAASAGFSSSQKTKNGVKGGR